MTDLKPCPFCGGEAYIQAKHMPNWTWNWCNVVCDGCGATVTRAGGEGTFEGAEKAAIAAWNSRAELTCRIIEYDEAPYPVCSECGAVQPDDFTVHYCWSCGAKVVEQ